MRFEINLWRKRKKMFTGRKSTERYGYRWHYIAAVVLLFCCIPLLIPGLTMGSDDTFHIGRLYSLGLSIREGIFPAQIRFSLCYGYGYGEGFFYPDLFLYLPAFFVAAGVPVVVVMKMYVLLVFMGIMLAMSKVVYRLTDNLDVALMCACLYTLSHKVFGLYYLDFSIGSFTASIFIPIAIGGLYLALTRNQGWGMFVIGCIGCIGTHLITTFLVAIVCFLILLINALGWRQRIPIWWRKLFFCSGFLVLITGAYWLPMAEQMFTVRLKSNIHWTVEKDNICMLHDLLMYRGVGIGIALAAIAIVFLFFSCRKHGIVSVGGTLFGGIGLLYLLLPSSRNFWEFLNDNISLTFLQFPSRLYQTAAALLVMSLGCFLTARFSKIDFYSKKRKEKFCKLVGFSFCAFLIAISMGSDIVGYFIHSEVSIGYDSVEAVESGTIACAGSGQEWMPLEVDTETLTANDEAISASGEHIQGEKSRGGSEFTFCADSSEEWYDVPFIYYKGYRATDEKGNEYITTGDPQNGLLRVEMPQNEKGRVRIVVSYQGTKIQKVGYLLTAVGLFTGSAWFLEKCFRFAQCEG